MGKASNTFIASSFVLLAIVGTAYCHDVNVKVVGSVYCDPCHATFPTTLSKNVPGAVVELVCKNRDTKDVTMRWKAKTNQTGYYEIITTEHPMEICEVRAISTPDTECNRRAKAIIHKKVDLSHETEPGFEVRFCQPVGFRTEKEHPECSKVIKKMKDKAVS